MTCITGEDVPDPKLANSLTLPVRTTGANSVSLVVNNGTAAELPAGTTAEWANKAQVEADVQHAGNYAEDVLVTFPDGSQVTVKAQMDVAAKLSNATHSGTSTTVKNVTYQEIANEKLSLSGNAQVTDAEGNLMTRETYKAMQQTKQGRLPQTGNNQTSILAMVGVTLATAVMSMFGFKKRG